MNGKSTLLGSLFVLAAAVAVGMAPTSVFAAGGGSSSGSSGGGGGVRRSTATRVMSTTARSRSAFRPACSTTASSRPPAGSCARRRLPDRARHAVHVRDQQDDVVLTYIGYSKRKLGAVDEGIAYYHRALAINPDNVNTREYLGEGYVAMGRFDLARGRIGEDRGNLRDRLRPVCPARVGYCRRVGIAHGKGSTSGRGTGTGRT